MVRVSTCVGSGYQSWAGVITMSLWPACMSAWVKVAEQSRMLGLPGRGVAVKPSPLSAELGA
jgi:hypothetical protein